MFEANISLIVKRAKYNRKKFNLKEINNLKIFFLTFKKLNFKHLNLIIEDFLTLAKNKQNELYCNNGDCSKGIEKAKIKSAIDESKLKQLKGVAFSNLFGGKKM